MHRATSFKMEKNISFTNLEKFVDTNLEKHVMYCCAVEKSSKRSSTTNDIGHRQRASVRARRLPDTHFFAMDVPGMPSRYSRTHVLIAIRVSLSLFPKASSGIVLCMRNAFLQALAFFASQSERRDTSFQ